MNWKAWIQPALILVPACFNESAANHAGHATCYLVRMRIFSIWSRHSRFLAAVLVSSGGTLLFERGADYIPGRHADPDAARNLVRNSDSPHC